MGRSRRLGAFGLHPDLCVGVCLLVPGTFFTVMGAVLFAGYWGFLYIYMGALAGTTAAFWIGRTFGRELAASLIGERLRKYDDAIERNGFAVVLYLRLIHFPFTPLNFGMGLTGVKFWDYFWGTGWGILVGVSIFTFFLGGPPRGLGRRRMGAALLPQGFLFRGPFRLFFLPSGDPPEDKKRKGILGYGYTGMKEGWSGGCFYLGFQASGGSGSSVARFRFWGREA